MLAWAALVALGSAAILEFPRPRRLAAGGAMLAQVWGLGLGVTSAHAAAADPGTDLVSRAEALNKWLTESIASVNVV